VTDYEPGWNLRSIPDQALWSEIGRRRAAQSRPRARITAPCVGCGLRLGVAERRKPCPECGARQPRATAKRRKSKRRA
jgi:predicted RNA-binding Zn-ribbon protein involved in translation (DUF1610 family)